MAVTSTLIRRHTAAWSGRGRRLRLRHPRVTHRSRQARGSGATTLRLPPPRPIRCHLYRGHSQHQASSLPRPYPHPLACQHEGSNAAEESGQKGIEGEGPHKQRINKLQGAERSRAGVTRQLPPTQARAISWPRHLLHTWMAAAASASAEKVSSTCEFGAGSSGFPDCLGPRPGRGATDFPITGPQPRSLGHEP